MIDSKLIPREGYFTDSAGNVFMYINVIGHVKSPGSYLVYEGADLLSILAQAGGPLPGAKVKEIVIYHRDSDPTIINLNKYLMQNDKLDLKSNDSIYIGQTTSALLRLNSTLLSPLLSVINIFVTLILNM